MKIAITGGRAYKLQPADWIWLGKQMAFFTWNHEKDEKRRFETITILHGAARGVDTEVSALLASFGFRIAACPAEWEKHGRAAGTIRNESMARYADLVLAFPGGVGTQHMIDVSRQLHKEVRESPTRGGK